MTLVLGHLSGLVVKTPGVPDRTSDVTSVDYPQRVSGGVSGPPPPTSFGVTPVCRYFRVETVHDFSPPVIGGKTSLGPSTTPCHRGRTSLGPSTTAYHGDRTSLGPSTVPYHRGRTSLTHIHLSRGRPP